MNTTEFDEIRPYNDEELSGVFEELIADPAFQKVVAGVIPDVPFEMLAQKMRACRTKLEFQKTFCYGLLWKLAGDCTDGISLDHTAIPDKSKAYTYISNHRDIILDSGFLSVLLVDQGMDTVEIAIGDNLLIYPWIKKFVRVNKSFIVQRANLEEYWDYIEHHSKRMIGGCIWDWVDQGINMPGQPADHYYFGNS